MYKRQDSTTCKLRTSQGGQDVYLKYKGTNPQLNASSTLVWVMSYQTIS